MFYDSDIISAIERLFNENHFMINDHFPNVPLSDQHQNDTQ